MPSTNFSNHVNGVTWAIKNGFTFDEALKILDSEIEKLKAELKEGEH